MNSSFLLGLKFKYVSGEEDNFKGTNAGRATCGAIQTFDIDFEEGDFIVGVTVEQCSAYPRRIGFNLMRFN